MGKENTGSVKKLIYDYSRLIPLSPSGNRILSWWLTSTLVLDGIEHDHPFESRCKNGGIVDTLSAETENGQGQNLLAIG